MITMVKARAMDIGSKM